MEPKLREILDTIDTVLATMDDTAYRLWDVLTALRGPDTAGQDIKEAATVKIRRAAFPKTTTAGHQGGFVLSRSFPMADFGSNDADNGAVQTSADSEQWHLNSHIESAARALGLRIDGHTAEPEF